MAWLGSLGGSGLGSLMPGWLRRSRRWNRPKAWLIDSSVPLASASVGLSLQDPFPRLEFLTACGGAFVSVATVKNYNKFSSLKNTH